MEEVFPRTPKTDIPEVFVREIGKGRVVYFPWDIDRSYWEVLCVDHGKLLRNAVTWAANEAPPVTVTGQGVLDVTVWKQASSMTVHMVNLSNAMMMKGPLREFLPTPPQEVTVRLPDGVKAKKVQLLASGATPRVREANGGSDGGATSAAEATHASATSTTSAPVHLLTMSPKHPASHGRAVRHPVLSHPDIGCCCTPCKL